MSFVISYILHLTPSCQQTSTRKPTGRAPTILKFVFISYSRVHTFSPINSVTPPRALIASPAPKIPRCERRLVNFNYDSNEKIDSISRQLKIID